MCDALPPLARNSNEPAFAALDKALVRATNRHVLRREGRDVVGFTTYTDTDVRHAGEWLCVQAQLTPVTAGREPGDETITSVYERGVRTR